MAVPKGKVSKSRRDKRRANWKLTIPGMVESCGYYNGKEVIKKVED